MEKFYGIENVDADLQITLFGKFGLTYKGDEVKLGMSERSIDVQILINTQLGYIGEGVFANGQGRSPYANYEFDEGNFADNGCMAMSIYNSNIVLGIYSDFSTIENEIVQKDVTIVNGHLGGIPGYINQYYENAGYEVDSILFPTQNQLEQLVQANETCILMYVWSNSSGIGAHLVIYGISKEAE